MSSTKKFLDFILDQLSELDEVTYRSMMGEYIIYYRGKIIGGIYDDRFLIKPTSSSIKKLSPNGYQIPYSGAKKMLIPDIENKTELANLIKEMFPELPVRK